MLNRSESIKIGVASPNTVVEAWAKDPDIDCATGNKVVNTLRELSVLLDSPQTRLFTIAAIASLLNRDFEKRGRLFRLDKDGNMDWEFYSSSMTRDIMAGLLKE